MKNKKLVALLLVAVMLLSAMPIFASAAPAYWGNASYNTVTNVGANEVTSFPTTLKKLSATEYSMSCKTEQGTLTNTFIERPWGMFNLGSWKLVDNNGKTHTFLAASTDWEYVYRTQKTATGSYVWSGGNHGNEVLVSLKFYNGETGQEISLSNGQSITVNKLHIIEKSKLLFKADTDGDGYGYRYKTDSYTDSDVYANATRKYTIAGPQIKLNVDYEYVKDTYHQLSYTCMFPINKDYGLYCDMYNQAGNKLATIQTSKSTQNIFYRPYSATRAVMYGDVNSKYKFDVHVNTVVDSLDSLKNYYKTMYWNMNLGTNKLYFSKYEDGTTTKVAAGTKFNTECAWKFFYDANGNGLDDDSSSGNTTTDKNLVSGKDFFGTHNWKKYFADLTDGIANNTITFNDTDWFCFYYHPDLTEQENISQQNSNALGGVGTVGYELDGTYKLNKVRVNTFLGNYSGIIAPESIAVEVSTDGTTYNEVGKKTFAKPATDSKTVGWVEFNLNDVEAKYVRLKIDLNGVMAFINEIEVYGKSATQAPEVSEPEESEPEESYPDIDESKLTNVALNKDYEAQTYTTYTADLTDGTAATTVSFNSNWFAFYYNMNGTGINAPNGVGEVVIDLDGTFDIAKVKINGGLYDSAGVGLPSMVNVFLSDDGITWGRATTLDLPANTTDRASYTIEDTVRGTASFIKFEFTLNKSFVFFNELEVYGVEAQPETSEPEVSEPEVSEPEVSEPEVSEPEESKPEVSEPEVSEPEVSEPEVSEPETSDPEVSDDEIGDIDEDGDIDAADYVLVKRAVLNTYELTEQQKVVADIDADSDVDATDYVLVKRIVLGTYKAK